MSVQATTWVLEDAPDLKPHLVAVLIALANHADHDGRGSYPSQELLARYTRKGVRAVREDLDSLEACSLIRRGDQRVVLHLPADKRPVVWDLAMSPADPRREPRPERRPAGRPKKAQVKADTENGRAQEPTRFSDPEAPPENGGVQETARFSGVNRGGAQIQIGGVHTPYKPSLEPSLNQEPDSPTDYPRGDDSAAQPSLIPGPAKPVDSEPAGETVQQRAFGISRGWINYRTEQGTPPVMRGGDPLHALAKLITPALNAGYSDVEVKNALVLTDTSLPSAQQLERALVEVRKGRRPGRSGRPDPATLRVNDHWDEVDRLVAEGMTPAAAAAHLAGERVGAA